MQGERASHAHLEKHICVGDDEQGNVNVNVTESVKGIEHGVAWLAMSVQPCLIVPYRGYELGRALWRLAVQC